MSSESFNVTGMDMDVICVKIQKGNYYVLFFEQGGNELSIRLNETQGKQLADDLRLLSKAPYNVT